MLYLDRLKHSRPQASEKELISQLLHQAEQIMDQADTIHVKIAEGIIEQKG